MRIKKSNIYLLIISMALLVAPVSYASNLKLNQANTNFQTGDNFHFDSSGSRTREEASGMELKNDTTAQLYRLEERYNADYETSEGGAELTVVKESSNRPAFNDPDLGAFDTLLLVDSYGQSIDPSYKEGFENTYSLGDIDNGFNGWTNHTWGPDNTAGRQEKNDGDNQMMPAVSNATYLFLFPEMSETSQEVRDDFWYVPGYADSSFDGQIPLTERLISSQSRMFNINGFDHTLNVNTVVSRFDNDFSESYNGEIVFGDQFDPNAQRVPVDVTLTLTISMHYNHTYDSTNGMLLEVVEYTYFDINVALFNSSYSVPIQFQDGGPNKYSVDMVVDVWGDNRHTTTLSGSNTFYGSDRPQSVGTQRLMAGDYLMYDFDQGYDYDRSYYFEIGDPALNGVQREEDSWRWESTYGDMMFDVFRHDNFGFEAVLFMDGMGEGDEGHDYYELNHNNPNYDNYSNPSPLNNRVNYQVMGFESTADQEIKAFFDDFARVRVDVNNLFGGNIFMPFDERIPKDGALNHTMWHMDLPSNETVFINDFEYSWFNVNAFVQEYRTTFTGTAWMEIWEGSPNPYNLTLSISGEARAEQGWYYDDDTGVLVHMEQRSNVHLTLEGSSVMPYEGGNEDVYFYLETNSEDKFQLTLSEHPHEYLSAQGPDPVNHTTSEPTSDTTSNPTSDVTETPTDTTTPPGLDLPFNWGYGLVALLVIPVIKKRRN